MLMDWLEPAIEKRLWEVIQKCENENADTYKQFSITFDHLKEVVPTEVITDLFKLENCFVQRMLVVETAYRAGLEDGINILKNQFIKSVDKSA